MSEQDLAVLFLGNRNFTGLLQTGSEQENVESVKNLLDLSSSITSGFGGRIVDRAGDSV